MQWTVSCREHTWFNRKWTDRKVAFQDMQDHNKEFHKGKTVAVMNQNWG